jgi:hypothetical protein
MDTSRGLPESVLRRVQEGRGGDGLDFSLAPPVAPGAIDGAWPHGVPDELRDLWLTTAEVRLFEDTDYGQWGLVLLGPEGCAECTAQEKVERPDDYRPDDIVVGEFLGDEDLLVLTPSSGGSERVKVALPLYPRKEWYAVRFSHRVLVDRAVPLREATLW